MKVFVLGAGCSFDEQHGYPLAKQFLSELNSFATRIAGLPGCVRIKSAVEATVKLLIQSQNGPVQATTIDQLINLILNRRCDDQLRTMNGTASADIVGLRYLAVRRAKIATAACFLDKEQTARQRHIDKYREFIQRNVLGETGVSTPCRERLRKSRARVLSFNYDRLFELAFFASLADSEMSRFGPYSEAVLNSGLDAFGEVSPIQQDRFCFLKLHGSIGLHCKEDEFGEKAFPIGEVANWKALEVTDSLFFSPNHQAELASEPLIVFPYEKDFIMSGRDNKLSFRSYITAVWTQATNVLRNASEIWIIGYSFDPTDAMSLIERMQAAHKCERIVIQNLGPECERIRDLLMTDYQVKTQIILKPLAF